MIKATGAAILRAATAWPGSAAAALATMAATPGFALGSATYHIRNGSPTPIACQLRAERGDIFSRFGLRPGSEIRQTVDNVHGGRLLICSTSVYRRFTFRVEAGRAYELIETRRGALRLRTVGSN